MTTKAKDSICSLGTKISDIAEGSSTKLHFPEDSHRHLCREDRSPPLVLRKKAKTSSCGHLITWFI